MRLRIEIHALIPDGHPLDERAESRIASAASSVVGAMTDGAVRIRTDVIDESEDLSREIVETGKYLGDDGMGSGTLIQKANG